MSDDVFLQYGTYYDPIYSDKDYAGEAEHVAWTLRRADAGVNDLLELGPGTGRHGRLPASGGNVLGVAQLERLDEFVERKRSMGRRYEELLKDVPGLQPPLARTHYAENIYWVYGVVLDDDVPFNAAEAMRRLTDQAIGTRPFFWPMHEQPVLRRKGLFEGVTCPVAERIARRGFYLPSALALTGEQIDRVAEAMYVAFPCMEF